jgi:hypothetical protein
MPESTTTTIQVSTRNRDALLRLGRIMQAEHPEIWTKTPSFNAIVGYALTHDLHEVMDRLLPT